MRKTIHAAMIGTAAAALLVSSFTLSASAAPAHSGSHGKPKPPAADTLGSLGKRADLRIGTVTGSAG